jgi:hypothetical protein
MTYNQPRSYYFFSILNPYDLEKEFEKTLNLGIKYIPIAQEMLDKVKKEHGINEVNDDDEIEEGEIITK